MNKIGKGVFLCFTAIAWAGPLGAAEGDTEELKVKVGFYALFPPFFWILRDAVKGDH